MAVNELSIIALIQSGLEGGGGGRVLPYKSCMGMCRGEGYGLQSLGKGIEIREFWSRIGCHVLGIA